MLSRNSKHSKTKQIEMIFLQFITVFKKKQNTFLRVYHYVFISVHLKKITDNKIIRKVTDDSKL